MAKWDRDAERGYTSGLKEQPLSPYGQEGKKLIEVVQDFKPESVDKRDSSEMGGVSKAISSPPGEELMYLGT